MYKKVDNLFLVDHWKNRYDAKAWECDQTDCYGECSLCDHYHFMNCFLAEHYQEQERLEEYLGE